MRTFLRLAFSLAAALSVEACVTRPPTPTPPPTAAPACPAGQQRLRTAQLFFSRNPDLDPKLADAAFRKFVEEELTPRFHDGLTVLDGGEKWQGPENSMLRASAKVVLIVLPEHGDDGPRLEAVRAAYKVQFHQDSILQITGPACVTY